MKESERERERARQRQRERDRERERERESWLPTFYSSEGPEPLIGTVVRLTDVTIGQCVVSDRNLARAILIRHKTLSVG